MSKTILVVETDPNQHNPYLAILGNLGYIVISCVGSDAFETITMQEPDLIIVEDGRDSKGANICKILKGSPFTSDTPVILTSAFSGVQERAIECGADSYLPIPFEIDFLNTMAQRLMKLRD